MAGNEEEAVTAVTASEPAAAGGAAPPAPAASHTQAEPAWLERPDGKIEPYRQTIEQVTRVLRLPFWLICAQIAQESDFEVRAKSSCGAIGLMQIMPATARSCGVDPEKLWAPEANIRLGCRILADRRNVFQKETPEERLKFGLAAYNGGLGPVINAQALAFRHGFDPSQWQNIRLTLPETWVYLDGEWQKPDYKQIIDYVDRIWQRYEAWKQLDADSAGRS